MQDPTPTEAHRPQAVEHRRDTDHGRRAGGVGRVAESRMGLRQPHTRDGHRRGPAESNSTRREGDDRVRGGTGTSRCRVGAGGYHAAGFASASDHRLRPACASHQPLFSSFVRREQCDWFEGCEGQRTHRLDVLLHFSGAGAQIKTRLMAKWSIVAIWEPEARYRRVGTATVADAAGMIRAARSVLSAL